MSDNTKVAIVDDHPTLRHGVRPLLSLEKELEILAEGGDQVIGLLEWCDREVLSRSLMTEAELKRAVDREEFEVHYQPIVYLGTGEALGFEALLRWRHPQKGLIPPRRFIPLAEETRSD